VSPRSYLGYFAVLVLIGAGWGMAQPLIKTAVSTGHQPFGLIFWQLAIMSTILFGLLRVRGLGVPVHRRYLWRYIFVALVGTILPNGISYAAAVHLPSGFISIVISLVPMFSLPIAILIGMERFSPLRFIGVICGAVAIVLLAGPGASLSDPKMAIWVAFVAFAPLMYAIEGTWVARTGMLDLAPMQLLAGASLVGVLIVGPVALATGQWVDPTAGFGIPEQALVASSVIHAFVYTAYFWLVGRAGSVFASLVSYLVTGFGLLWAAVFLGETYAAQVWVAVAFMMVGLFLVRPKTTEPAPPLVPRQSSGDNGGEG